MCKDMEEHDKKTKVEGGIEAFRTVWGNDDKKIVESVSKVFKVTPAYVRRIMNGLTTSAATVRAYLRPVMKGFLYSSANAFFMR